MAADQQEIDSVVATFFDAFSSGPGLDERMGALRAVLLPDARIVRTCGRPEVYDVDTFIEPRRELLAGDRLTGFREWEVEGTTEVWGDIAHRWCSYAKEWDEDGRHVAGRGQKSLQLVRTGAGWRISAVAWDDEETA